MFHVLQKAEFPVCSFSMNCRLKWPCQFLYCHLWLGIAMRNLCRAGEQENNDWLNLQQKKQQRTASPPAVNSQGWIVQQLTKPGHRLRNQSAAACCTSRALPKWFDWSQLYWNPALHVPFEKLQSAKNGDLWAGGSDELIRTRQDRNSNTRRAPPSKKKVFLCSLVALMNKTILYNSRDPWLFSANTLRRPLSG